MHLLNCDAIDWLRFMPPESVDLIVTDPPYRTISGGNVESGNQPYGRPTGMLSNNDGRIFAHNDAPVATWMPLLFRALRSPGHCYVMTNLLNLFEFRDVAIASGFRLHNLLVWRKNICTPNRWYMKDAEFILFLRKGPARSIYTPSEKMIQSHTAPRDRTHPTEKPVALMETLIAASSNAGELVCDPFMGSGAAAVAAARLGRRFVGCEIDGEYYRAAVERQRCES